MRWAILALMLAACASQPAAVPRATARPVRVMSVNQCTDQLVLALLPPDRIASVTWLSRDPAGSLMARAAARVGTNHGAAEEVLAQRPDLVVAGTFSTPALRAMLHRLGYPLLEVDEPQTLADIRRVTREVAARLGERARGEALIAAMDAKLAALAREPGARVRVVAWDRSGFGGGEGTLLGAVLDAAGAGDASRELAPGARRPDVELLLRAAPTLLVRGSGHEDAPDLGDATARHRVVRRLWGAAHGRDPARGLRLRDADDRRGGDRPARAPPRRRAPDRLMRRLVASLALLLVALAAVSLAAGRVWLTPAQVIAALADPRADLARLIVTEVRLPRVVLALLVGAILGMAGAVLQGLLRNPLAEPGLLGVSAGASLGAVIAIYYGFAAMLPLATPLFALAGAGATVAVALALARGGGTLSLILAGVAVSTIAGAGVSVALNLAPSPFAAYEIMTWLMGSLVDRSWDHVQLAAPFIVVGAALLLATAPALDALALGERQAASLGVDIARTRLLALVGTALGVGAATAVTGTIGFVGLLAPHLVRPLVGHRPGATLVPAALAGAAIVLAADLATRLLPFGQTLQLGVFISVIGAPFFLWLVLRVERRGA